MIEYQRELLFFDQTDESDIPSIKEDLEKRIGVKVIQIYMSLVVGLGYIDKQDNIQEIVVAETLRRITP